MSIAPQKTGLMYQWQVSKYNHEYAFSEVAQAFEWTVNMMPA